MLPGHSARLLSRPLRGSRAAQCLSFFYHMYGSGTGSLRVLLHSEHEDGDMVLWERSGAQSISWMKASVTYQCDHHHQVSEGTQNSSECAYRCYFRYFKQVVFFFFRLYLKPPEDRRYWVTLRSMTLNFKRDRVQVPHIHYYITLLYIQYVCISVTD